MNLVFGELKENYGEEGDGKVGLERAGQRSIVSEEPARVSSGRRGSLDQAL